VEALARGERPPAVLRPAPGRLVSPADFPPPRFEPRLTRYYTPETGMLNYQTKRGCPHACAYCTYPALEGRKFRPREPGEVAEELSRLAMEQGVRSFFFTDSVFNDAKGHSLAVAEELVRRDLGLTWYAYFRPQNLDRESLRLYKRAGLAALELGTDAACDATLTGLDKGFTFSEVEKTARAIAAEQLPSAHFVIFGGPGETEETVEEGLVNLARLEQTVVFAYTGIRILPGAPLHARALAEGVIADGESLLKPRFYFSPAIDPERMNARIEEAFRGRRDRIFPPSAGQERLAVMKRFGYRGLLWDRLLRFPDGEGAAA